MAAVATPGEWQSKTSRSSEWAQHFSNASCLYKYFIVSDTAVKCVCLGSYNILLHDTVLVVGNNELNAKVTPCGHWGIMRLK